MFRLQFLLICLVVLIDGTSITRYAIQEDLDMPNVTTCHIGVLAMDKEGTIWVIYYNDNGTYSMIWNHTWQPQINKTNIWKPSAHGTTLEGAAGVRIPKGDLVFDSCWDAMDSVIRYFSIGSDKLSISASQICIPNRRYCGHDPEAQAMEVDIHRQRQKLLISCGDDGRIADVDICDQNCISDLDKAGYARCECNPYLRYCGHELHALGWGPEYDNDTLYLCLGGLNVIIAGRCPNGCVIQKKNSICYGTCEPNESFCGQMGLDWYDQNAVYQCDTSGQSAHIIANCSEECWESTSGYAACLCHPGRTYCVHELYTQMNWLEVKDEFSTYPHTAGVCLPEKNEIKLVFSCINCIATQGEKDAYCQWTPGVYCGRDLNAIGWTGHENDTMYQCGEEERNVSIISMCQSGTCVQQHCWCIPKRAYCGYQLYLMGWRKVDSEWNQGHLWQCVPNGQEATRIGQCNRCTNLEGRARCECMDSELYCGYELLTEPPYEDNGVYRCSKDGRPSLVKVCKQSCIRVPVLGASPNVEVPDCLGECLPGETYCGSKLLTLGFTGYNNNRIYTCSVNGRNVTDTEQVDTLCTKCTPGRIYCGYQLSDSTHIWEHMLQSRFSCNSDGTYGTSGLMCNRCISSDAGAYCWCPQGTKVCGYEIESAGWQKYLGTTNYTDDTLFRCDQEGKMEIVEQCPMKECRSYMNGVAHCMCSPGQSYCGHELEQTYNSPDTILSPNSIYQCSENQLVVNVIKECVTCVSMSGNPVCRQQCIQNRLYCGSDLLKLEGWDDLDLGTLYQCTNGSFAQSEMTCTQGCQGKNEDVDAYCLGLPMAWYWIFMLVTLPALFISLCMWLIRTIIQHRRLQKFVDQQRIIADQLKLIRKLGNGQFGEVHLAQYTDPSGHQMDVAVKISKHHLNTNDGQNLASANCFFQESVALDFLRHQNITRALGICSNLKMAGGITCPALVLEYMDGGNSADYILKEREHLQTSDLMKIFIDICQAGEHLQKMGVIHRDIGARNVLIRKHPRNGKPAVAKLTDFGLAKDIGKNTTQYKSPNAMFHEGYTAPEGFRGEFSSQSDVWSFGVFMWELYMLMDRNLTEPVAPYSDIPSPDILIQIGDGYRLRRPVNTPTGVYAILTSCWSWMPESRPTFRQLRKTLKAQRILEVEPGRGLELHRVDPVTDGGEEQEEETAFSEQSAPNGGYGSPR